MIALVREDIIAEAERFEREYAAQKPLPKKIVARDAKPSTWVEVRWKDTPNNVMLVTKRERPSRPGPFTLEGLELVNGALEECDFESDQVVRILGKLEFPSL